jgi:hypothetical protein
MHAASAAFQARVSPGRQADRAPAQPAGVVKVVRARARNERPARSRLSKCWSWLKSTVSTAPISSAETAGRLVFSKVTPAD